MELNDLIKYSVLALIGFLIVVYLFLRYLRNESNSISLSRSLMNYFKDKEDIIGKGYNTFDNEQKEDKMPKIPVNTHSEKAQKDKQQSIIRFASDYCRANNEISVSKRMVLHQIGWRPNKYWFEVKYESGQFVKTNQSNSILCLVPINKAWIDITNEKTKDMMKSMLTNLSSDYILPYCSLDILNHQKILVKVTPLYEGGTLRDMIYKTVICFNKYPMDNISHKQSKYKNGVRLSTSLIFYYAKQILNALSYLHRNKYYMLHLHSGNVALSKDHKIKFLDIENALIDIPIKNEAYFRYVYEYYAYLYNTSKDNDISVITEAFMETQLNVFEQIDVICFGRLIYEMAKGKELMSPFPDELEYAEMDSNISELLKIIFKKGTKSSFNKNALTLPNISIDSILKFKMFNNIDLGESMSNHNNLDDCDISIIDECHETIIKDKIFNPRTFIKSKLKILNNYLKN